jgi:UDP-GlcNAc:undecaprenyl-phosphate GlcNAc-1-phosphate transferase
MDILLLSIFFITLFIIELLYFKVADQYNIIDKPNHRSSHTNVTLRGGGIIFSVGMLIYPIFFTFEHKLFLLGLLTIAFISFLDDINPVNNKVRLLFQIISGYLLIYDCGLQSLPYYWLILICFFIIGTINAINFMDGINGMTGLYSLVALLTLLYIDLQVINFVATEMLITAILSTLVFLYFNFRVKAKCFAGDVGSIGIAFIIIFFIIKLVILTEDISYAFLLLLYGLDVVTTIIFRIIRRERISEAHRSHFYQFLANEKKIPQLLVSSLYAFIQIIMNAILLWSHQSVVFNLIFILCSSILFTIVRFQMEGFDRLVTLKVQSDL